MTDGNIIFWAWQMPQNILGLCLRLWYHDRIVNRYKYKGVRYIVVSHMAGGGVSLGHTVIVRNNPFGIDWNTWNHEYGHTRQSLYLGWLYLVIIGLPSILWLLWHRSHKKHSYYWFYTERWADRLGGVVRT